MEKYTAVLGKKEKVNIKGEVLFLNKQTQPNNQNQTKQNKNTNNLHELGVQPHNDRTNKSAWQ